MTGCTSFVYHSLRVFILGFARVGIFTVTFFDHRLPTKASSGVGVVFIESGWWCVVHFDNPFCRDTLTAGGSGGGLAVLERKLED